MIAIRTPLRLSMRVIKSHHMHNVSSLRFSTSKSKEIQPPTTKQLQIVALRYAIPMIGFGFMDNLVMIQAGDAIDNTFGVALGISYHDGSGLRSMPAHTLNFAARSAAICLHCLDPIVPLMSDVRNSTLLPL